MSIELTRARIVRDHRSASWLMTLTVGPCGTLACSRSVADRFLVLELFPAILVRWRLAGVVGVFVELIVHLQSLTVILVLFSDLVAAHLRLVLLGVCGARHIFTSCVWLGIAS